MRILLGIVLLYFASSFLIPKAKVNSYTEVPKETKLAAFKILQNKCNVCHKIERRREIFTLDNMDSYASKIEKQVFVKRKMPKGDDFNLTKLEESTLMKWLTNVQKSTSKK